MKFTDTTSASSVAAQGGASAIFLTFLNSSIIEMIPYLIVAFLLVLVDLNFGILAANKRGEKVRCSRAVRRTAGKAFEYFCWITISSTLSIAFETRLIEFGILGLVMGIELTSIISNWLEARGKVIRGLNIIKIIGDKAGVDLSEVKIEDKKDENN